MATSLEELLAKEGFRGRKSKMLPRASFGSESASMPLYPFRDPNKPSSSSGSRKTLRTKSDVPRNSMRGDLMTSDRYGDRRSRDKHRREKWERGLSKEIMEKTDSRGSKNFPDVEGIGSDSVENLSGTKLAEFGQSNEIVEVGVEENEKYKDIYSNEVYSPERSVGTLSNGTRKAERYKEISGKHRQVDKMYNNNSDKHLLGGSNFSDNYSKMMKKSESLDTRSNRNSTNVSFKYSKSRRNAVIEQNADEPALDEVAIQAVISIFAGYIKRFLKDEDFRTSLRHNCFASLSFIELKEGVDTESKVIANLEQAIETVERAAEEFASARELKKASLQLSVITGLNSNELKDGFTAGIPNSKLSACAHLYLSVVYTLQKKDRISAKHLLQVFCDSPFQARKTLLPEFWDDVFLPHLSHLKEWYNQEANSVGDMPNKGRKIKLLEKVYNELLDSGTYQFAVYYKDWLTEGVESPSIPSIQIPSVTVQGIQQQGLHRPFGVSSPQPMVSKKLYDAVFGRSHKPGVDEVENYEEAENFDHSTRSYYVSTVEDKQRLTYSSETVKHVDHDIQRYDAYHLEDGQIAEESWSLHRESAPGDKDINDKFDYSDQWQATSGNRTNTVHLLTHSKENELTLKWLAKSIFELQQTEESVDLTATTLLSHSENAPYPNALLPRISSSIEDLHGNCECFDKGPFLSSIPKDFICPLTGQLFEDPVTIETGQTFERVAIKEWFDKGNRTCPITGKTLDCEALPLTNFILKRVIDNWKSEHSGEHKTKFKDETAVFVLHQLLSTFSEEQRITKVKHLISLGGLQCLIRRFEYGNLEEKTLVAALLSCFIEVDSDCRNYIARHIRKSGLLELIHSMQVKSRANAVTLLTELICLHRRKDVNLFLSGLNNEGIVNTVHVLLVYLQSCPSEQRPLVAVLLLHLDLLVEPRKYSIYREEAVDAITVALDSSLSDEKVRATCCRALLILGGRFSVTGKITTEDWILKEAGFFDGPELNSVDNGDNVPVTAESFLLDDDEAAMEEWLKNLSASLLGDGKKSFVETISKCIGFGDLDLVRVCLTTVAWLSSALASLSDGEFQLSAFSALISPLKEILEDSERVEHRILSSLSLFNFSKISECRILLITIAEEIAIPLRSLVEQTWTAKELYAIISGEDL